MTTPSQPQYSVPAPKGASGAYIRAADGLVAVGALIVFFFSFAPFISAPSETFAGTTVGGGSENAWKVERPVVMFVVFAAILLIATSVIDTWWKREEQKVGLNRHHVQVGLSLYVFVTLLAFAFTDKGGASFGWGAIFMLLGSIVAAAGAILNHFNMLQGPLSLPSSGSSAAPAAYPPAPQGYAPPQGYVPPADQQQAPPTV
jgi:hypothetical protein